MLIWKYILRIGNPITPPLSAARVRLGPLLRPGAAGRARRTPRPPRDPDVRASRHVKDRSRAGTARAHRSASSSTTPTARRAQDDQASSRHQAGLYKPKNMAFKKRLDSVVTSYGRSAPWSTNSSTSTAAAGAVVPEPRRGPLQKPQCRLASTEVSQANLCGQHQAGPAPGPGSLPLARARAC